MSFEWLQSCGNRVTTAERKHTFYGLMVLFLRLKWNGHSKRDSKHDLSRISTECVLVAVVSYLQNKQRLPAAPRLKYV